MSTNKLTVIPSKSGGSSRYEVLSILSNGGKSVYTEYLKFLKNSSSTISAGDILHINSESGTYNPIVFIFTSSGSNRSTPTTEDILSAVDKGFTNIAALISKEYKECPSIEVYSDTSAFYRVPWKMINERIALVDAMEADKLTISSIYINS